MPSWLRDDPVGSVFLTVFWTGFGLAVIYGVYLSYVQEWAWVKPLFGYCWWWWGWKGFEDPVFSFLAKAALFCVSVVLSALAAYYVFVVGLAFLASLILALLGLGWWKLATYSTGGMVVACVIAAALLGVVVAIVWAMAKKAELPLLAKWFGRRMVRAWEGFLYLVTFPFYGSRPRPQRAMLAVGSGSTAARALPGRGTHGTVEGVSRMPDKRKALTREEEGLAKRMEVIPQVIPGAGRVPANPNDWGGYLENIRQRVQMRSQTRTNRVVLDHLKVVNECYGEYLRYKKHVQELTHLDQRDRIQDLQRTVEERELEVKLKRLELETEEIETQRKQLQASAQRQIRGRPHPGERVIEQVRTMAELEKVGKKLAEEYPGQEEDIKRMVEDQRIRIMEGRG